MGKIPKENSMLLDIQYVRANRRDGVPDYLYIIWKDLTNGEKHLEAIPNPTMDIYFEKPPLRNHTYNKRYERVEHLDKVNVPYHSIIPAIAKEAGPDAQAFLNNLYTTQNYGRMAELQTYPYVFGSDYDIRAFYRIKWLENLDNQQRKTLTKGFLDIEADSLHIDGFADPKTCPVDLVTLIDKTTMTSYTFALVKQKYHEKALELMTPRELEKEHERQRLYDSRMEQEQELMHDIPGLKKELDEMFSEHYGHIDYNFYFYEDERKMLVHLFQLVHRLKLDFIEIWNIAFDIPFMYERLQVLGLDPKEVMCHPDFPNKECYFKKDRRNTLPKNKADFFKVSDYTVWADQMCLYAAIRKSGKELRSVKLTDIAHIEIKDEKLNYEEDGNIKTLPYKNYRKYVIYNIKDVLLQLGIETRTSDLDEYYTGSYKNATPYEQVYKQTLKLRNVQYLSFLKQGLIPGNNINIFNLNDSGNEILDEDEENAEDDDDVKFEGALVGNPLLNDYFGKELYGQPSNSIFDYSIDMDMSSFYPNTIYTMNIDASTLYFKCICNPNQFDVRGGTLPYHGFTDKQLVPKNKDSFADDIAKEIFGNFHSRNWLSFGHKWMNLPNVSDVLAECEKELG